MKKTKNVVVLVVLALALVTFCACGLLANATGIEITSYPKTSYTTADTDFDWTGFKLKITYSGTKEPETLTYEELKAEAGKSFNVSDFNRSVGTHTATITYQKLEVTFQYTVAAGTFAGGEGTKANPYQISTVEQFKNIGNNTNLTYFKLINDLDFADYTTVSLIKNAEIDGGGYSIKNLKTHLVQQLAASTFKNVDIYMNSEVAVFETLGDGTKKPVLIENVNIYGIFNIKGQAGQNDGILAYYVTTKLCRIKDVNIYADYISNVAYGAIFIGYTNYYNGDIYFENARFYGYAEGQRLGIFLGNTSAGFGKGTYEDDCRRIYIDENSGNFGTIITTMDDAQAFLFADSGNHNPQKDNRITIKKNGVELTTEENKAFFNKEGSTVERVYEASLKLIKTENNELKIECTNSAAASYIVIASVWTTDTRVGYTNTFTLISKTFEAAGETGIYVAEWKYKAEQTEIASEYDTTEICYWFNLGFTPEVNTFGTKAKDRKNNVQYTVYAYDANGKTLGAYTYGL